MSIEEELLDYTEAIRRLPWKLPFNLEFDRALNKNYQVSKISIVSKKTKNFLLIHAIDNLPVMGPPIEVEGSRDPEGNLDAEHIYVIERPLVVAGIKSPNGLGILTGIDLPKLGVK